MREAAGGTTDMLGNPSGAHERCNGNGQHVDRVLKPNLLREPRHKALQGMLSKSAGDKVNMFAGLVTHFIFSPLLLPAVDAEYLARDERRLRRRQVDSRLGHVFGCSPALEKRFSGRPAPANTLKIFHPRRF